MKKNIGISIITPAYNAEKYIERCIKSVLNQSFDNFEMIIVNDGSTDSTSVICEKYNTIDSRIKVINKNNEGVSKARNDAIKHASGKYLMFVDADDWLEEDMCECLYSIAEEKESEVVISGYFNFYENSGIDDKISLTLYNNRTFPELISDDSTLYGGFPWNKLILRDKVKFLFDDQIHYYENLLFFLQNFDENTKFEIVDKPLYHYCINDTSAVHSKKFNVKKLTSLLALKKIIDILPESTIMSHKVAFVSSYYNCWYGLVKEKYDKKLLNPYKKLKIFYLKNILKSKEISFKKKFKLLFIACFPFVYYILKYFKER